MDNLKTGSQCWSRKQGNRGLMVCMWISYLLSCAVLKWYKKCPMYDWETTLKTDFWGKNM